MPVTVEQERIDPCKVALTIQVPPEEIQKATDAVFGQLAKRTNVPGFRPGKAPKGLIKRFLDEDRVKDMAVERAVGDAYREAVKQADLHPFTQVEPDVELPEEEIDPEQGFTFKATVVLQPSVELGDLDGLSARRVVTRVTDEEVNREIDRLREQAARWQVVNRPLADGDRARITALITRDGEPVEELSEPEPTNVLVGSSFPGFDAGLRGMGPGEEKSFEFTYPEDGEEEALRGATLNADVRVEEVAERVLPEADDEFARQLGHDHLETMRSQLRERMQQQADRAAEEDVDEQLLRDVVRRAHVEFPEQLVDQEVSNRIDRLIHGLSHRGYTLSQFLRSQNIDLAALQASYRDDARQSVATTLVLLELQRANGIRVTDQDVEAEVRRRAEAENVKLSQMRRLLNDTGEIEEIRNRVFMEKVTGFLRGKAEIRDVEG